MTNVVRLAPEPLSSIIASEDVSVARLASVLDAAVIENEVDSDGDIYASDGLDFPVWISVSKGPKLVSFATYFNPNLFDTANVFQTLNDINTSIIVVQFSWHSEKLWGQYWMTYDGGVDVKHFIKMLRRFGGAFRLGCEKLSELQTLSKTECESMCAMQEPVPV